MADLADIFTRLVARIARIERRVVNGVRHGTVEPGSLDLTNKTVRLRIGGTDEKPLLSPPVRYAQHAGKFKLHLPPSDGQQMTLLSPTGDFKQGLAIPFGWGGENPSPSDKDDEAVFTIGSTKFLVKGDEVFVQRGEQTFHLKPSGEVHVKGSKIVLDGPVEMPKGFTAGDGEGAGGTINGPLNATKEITSQTRVSAPLLQGAWSA
ncbi:MAG: hypothetical protein DI527_00735 [Chelatococcus sp.]|nr:MAG: hypothetical protein DI527_00735 [Chelatococcus sp.]